MSQTTGAITPQTVFTAQQALEAVLEGHDGWKVIPTGPFGPWLCPCGTTVNDRDDWLTHVTSEVRALWAGERG